MLISRSYLSCASVMSLFPFTFGVYVFCEHDLEDEMVWLQWLKERSCKVVWRRKGPSIPHLESYTYKAILLDRAWLFLQIYSNHILLTDSNTMFSLSNMYSNVQLESDVCKYMWFLIYVTDLYIVIEYMHSVFENPADFEPTKGLSVTRWKNTNIEGEQRLCHIQDLETSTQHL